MTRPKPACRDCGGKIETLAYEISVREVDVTSGEPTGYTESGVLCESCSDELHRVLRVHPNRKEG